MTKLEKIESVLTRAPRAWTVPILTAMPQWGIDTPMEESSFLGTLAWESRQFTRLEENLNYTAERLVEVWPRRFSWDKVDGKRHPVAYSHNPIKLAEFVYGGRLGNSREGDGDGYKYRGRGPCMLTGKGNHARAAQATGFDLLQHPELLLRPEIGSVVSCWFWKDGGFDALDDDEDITAETRRYQGGTQYLAHRQALVDKIREALLA